MFIKLIYVKTVCQKTNIIYYMILTIMQQVSNSPLFIHFLSLNLPIISGTIVPIGAGSRISA